MKKMTNANSIILTIIFITIGNLILSLVDKNSSGRQAMIQLVIAPIIILIVLAIESIINNSSK